jgi:sigma-B regulation protein RsbU (phosphoserine phosphatase)
LPREQARDYDSRLRNATMSDLATSEPRRGLFEGTWQQRLDFVVEMMREMSSQTDPQVMVQLYGKRMRQILPGDGSISLSRRDLVRPRVRVTRSHTWDRSVNPWKARQRVILDGGLLADLIWNEEPIIIEDFCLARDDPSAPYLEGMRSLAAIPLFDKGHALNMVVQVCKQPNGFEWDDLPERVWMGNLFGRATHNLVLSEEVKRAYESVDRELKIVADMQRSLLPRQLPDIPGLELAAHYQTSKRAGGDYYDFFELPNGKWGILIADVSGHGTPAAVIMAVTHSIAHTHTGPPTPPSSLLNFINDHLTARYTTDTGTFVTAFYGIYDPSTRQLTYSCAGHNPPRVKHRDRSLISIEGALGLPLGIDPEERYFDAVRTLEPGDALVLYTDGIIEAHRTGCTDMFGLERLDEILTSCGCCADELVRKTLLAVEEFTSGDPPSDDRTLLVARVEP